MNTAVSNIVDWDTCKLQYELMGDPLARIAEAHRVPVDALNSVALDEGWTRLDPSSKQYTTLLAEVLVKHRAKLSIAMLYRELEAFPQVASVEASLIHKIQLTANTLDPNDTKTPLGLRNLSAALNNITNQSEILQSQLNTLLAEVLPTPVKVNMDFGNEDPNG